MDLERDVCSRALVARDTRDGRFFGVRAHHRGAGGGVSAVPTRQTTVDLSPGATALRRGSTDRSHAFSGDERQL